MRVSRSVSLMRFRFRRKVDLPQPEGPISAVTLLVGELERNVVQRLEFSVKEIDVGGAHLGRRGLDGACRLQVVVGVIWVCGWLDSHMW